MYSVVITGSAQNRYNGTYLFDDVKDAIQKACDNAAPFGDKYSFACSLLEHGGVIIADGMGSCVATINKLD